MLNKSTWNLVVFAIWLVACSKTDKDGPLPEIRFKTQSTYTHDGDSVKMGAALKFGLIVNGNGEKITNLVIKSFSNGIVTNRVDKGYYTDVLEETFNFNMTSEYDEIWTFTVMNQNRAMVSKTMTIYNGGPAEYQPIISFDTLRMGYQDNILYGQFLDATNGIVYSSTTVSGHESEIDLLIYYFTGSTSYPGVSCPGYVSATGYYPAISSWAVKNETLYDYNTSDNNLISPQVFDAARNDSLLIHAFNSSKTSGLCKYAYTGKIIPFKTKAGKYGMIKIHLADDYDLTNGTFLFALKIQK